ncbi:hypothetical protein BJ138DRAFT_1154967, partial [Hygrophoropsis aurantiaca]
QRIHNHNLSPSLYSSFHKIITVMEVPFHVEAQYFNVPTCFCGKPTIADHDNCYCSRICAQEDAARSLFGKKSHYRDIYQVAKRKAAEAHGIALAPLGPPANASHIRGKPTLAGASDSRNRTLRKPAAHWPTLEDITAEVMAKNGNVPPRGPYMTPMPPRDGRQHYHPHLDEENRVHPIIDLNTVAAATPPPPFLKRTPRSSFFSRNSVRRTASQNMLNRLRGTEPLRVEKRDVKRGEWIPEPLARHPVEKKPSHIPIYAVPRSPPAVYPQYQPLARPSCTPSRSVRRSISLAALDNLEDPLDDLDFNHFLNRIRDDTAGMEIDPRMFFEDDSDDD